MGANRSLTIPASLSASSSRSATSSAAAPAALAVLGTRCATRRSSMPTRYQSQPNVATTPAVPLIVASRIRMRQGLIAPARLADRQRLSTAGFTDRHCTLGSVRSMPF